VVVSVGVKEDWVVGAGVATNLRTEAFCPVLQNLAELSSGEATGHWETMVPSLERIRWLNRGLWIVRPRAGLTQPAAPTSTHSRHRVLKIGRVTFGEHLHVH
jgi:hypothetical protein